MTTNFTVEVIAAPAEGDWSDLYRVLDIVPGAVLIEDPEQPTLMIPVDADGPMRAARFVEGIAHLVGFEVRSGKIYPTPEVDFDVEDDESDCPPAPTSDVVRHVHDWMDSAPEIHGRLASDGTLVEA